jgi:hypothetical protein
MNASELVAGENDTVRIAGQGGEWVVNEVRGSEAFCVRPMTRMHGWYPVSSLTVTEKATVRS